MSEELAAFEERYCEILAARSALRIPGLMTYAEAGLEGPWITPYHIAARSPSGPVLVTYNYLDGPTAIANREVLLTAGFLQGMLFNRVLARALQLAGWERRDIYVTHAFHLLVPTRSAVVPVRCVETSFDSVARHELAGRDVIALGQVASAACRRFSIAHVSVAHPSARGRSLEAKAADLAKAIAAATSKRCA